MPPAPKAKPKAKASASASASSSSQALPVIEVMDTSSSSKRASPETQIEPRGKAEDPQPAVRVLRDPNILKQELKE